LSGERWLYFPPWDEAAGDHGSFICYLEMDISFDEYSCHELDSQKVCLMLKLFNFRNIFQWKICTFSRKLFANQMCNYFDMFYDALVVSHMNCKENKENTADHDKIRGNFNTGTATSYVRLFSFLQITTIKDRKTGKRASVTGSVTCERRYRKPPIALLVARSSRNSRGSQHAHTSVLTVTLATSGWTHVNGQWSPLVMIDNRSRSISQYSNMAPRLSDQTSIFGVVFFVFQVPFGNWETKETWKICNCDSKASERNLNIDTSNVGDYC